MSSFWVIGCSIQLYLIFNHIQWISCLQFKHILREEDYRKICLDKERETGLFLYDYQPKYGGCTVECIFLKQSVKSSGMGSMKDIYLDETTTYVQYLLKPQLCIDESHQCDFGSCKPISRDHDHNRPSFPSRQRGTVLIEIKDASIRGVSRKKSSPDPYVLIYADHRVYRSQIKYNTVRPEWNEEFSIPDHSVDGRIVIHVMDKDRFKDDQLGRFEFTPRQIIEEEMDGKFRTFVLDDQRDFIRIRISWMETSH